MADLALRWGWQRRLSHWEMKQMQRQMKLAQHKLDGMQWTIEMTELTDDIEADNLLEQLIQHNDWEPL